MLTCDYNLSNLQIQQVPFWCYLLTSKVAQSEFKKFAPSPKKQWKLNIARSPLKTTPVKPVQASSAKKVVDNAQARATPRTRTRRAVKSMINGVTEKYQAFEQNVAHQLSQKIFNPLSPKLKSIES